MGVELYNSVWKLCVIVYGFSQSVWSQQNLHLQLWCDVSITSETFPTLTNLMTFRLGGCWRVLLSCSNRFTVRWYFICYIYGWHISYVFIPWYQLVLSASQCVISSFCTTIPLRRNRWGRCKQDPPIIVIHIEFKYSWSWKN